MRLLSQTTLRLSNIHDTHSPIDIIYSMWLHNVAHQVLLSREENDAVQTYFENTAFSNLSRLIPAGQIALIELDAAIRL